MNNYIMLTISSAESMAGKGRSRSGSHVGRHLLRQPKAFSIFSDLIEKVVLKKTLESSDDNEFKVLRD